MKKVLPINAVTLPAILFLCISVLPLHAQVPGIGAEQERVIAFKGIINDIEYSPFGSYLVVSGRENLIRLYSSSLRTLWNLTGSQRYAKATTVMAFTHDEGYLIFPKYPSPEDIALLYLNTLEVSEVLYGHTREIRAIGLSGDSKHLVSSSRADDLILWEQKGSTYTKIAEAGGLKGRIGKITFHPEGNLFACALSDDTISLWAIEQGKLEPLSLLKPEQHYGNTGYLYGLAFSPDGDYLAAGLRNEITIWKRNAGSWEVHQVIPDIAEGYVQSLEFSPDGSYIACGFGRGVVRLYRLDGKVWVPADILDARQDYVEDLAIHPSGRSIVSAASWDSALVLWKTDRLNPNPWVQIQEALGGSLSRAQKQVLTRLKAEEIIDSIDPFMFEPKDEFETEDEFTQRKKELRGMLLKEVQTELELAYGVSPTASPPGTRKIIMSLQDLGTYDIEKEIYPVRVMDTPGTIRISRNEARDLKRNREKAVVTADVEPSADGISGVYTGFSLIHPKSGSLYPVYLEENPFHKEIQGGDTDEFREIQVGPYLVVQGITLETVFPVLYRYYESASLGKVELFNTGAVPVENIKLSLTMDRYMDSGGTGGLDALSLDLPAGQTAAGDVYALFNDSVLAISEGDTVSAQLTVSYTARGKQYEEAIPRTVRFLGRNAVTWDDDRKIAAFMTTKDPAVLKYAKQASSISGEVRAPGLDAHMITAMKIFESLSAVPMNYTIDPSSPYIELSRSTGSVDFIQFPGQTLDFKAGDCDDLSILFNTLLESLGIPTGFITFPGHIYAAFQLRMSPQKADQVFAGEREYIVQDNRVWIPVETTLLGKGFLTAWDTGIRQWKENEGRALLFSTGESWQTYEPVNFLLNREVPPPEEVRVTRNYLNALKRFTSREVRQYERELNNRSEGSSDDPRYLNSLGLVYARFAYFDEALRLFEQAVSNGEYLPAIMNAGNIFAFQGDMDKAVRYYLRAAAKAPENPRILLTLGKVYLKQGDYPKAEDAIGRARRIDPGIAVSLPEIDPGSTGRASGVVDPTDDPAFAEWE